MTFENGKLVGAPNVAENAFLKDGVIVNNAKFYFDQKVIDGLANLDESKADETTLAWAHLYKLFKTHFVVEKVDDVFINTDVIPTRLIKTDSDMKQSFIDKFTDSVANGLVVLNNTGVDATIALDIDENDVEFVLVEEGDEKYGELYEPCLTKYVATFKYKNSTDGCDINYGDKYLYVVTVYNAIKDAPTFYDGTESTIHAIDISADTNTYKITGFDKQSTSGGGLPVYYTTFKEGEHKFVYTDFEGTEHALDVTKVENFSVKSRTSEQTATITVDFYGFGTYKFNFKYVVEESKIYSIEQDGAISVPLNMSSTDAYMKMNVALLGRDGSRVVRTLGARTGLTSGFSCEEKPDTSTLGVKTLTVKYTAADDVENGVQSCVITYSVVLEADANLFGYDYVSQAKEPYKVNDVEYSGTAKITSCSAITAETIVLPTTWTDENGNLYLVTEIATAAFADFAKLKAVYLGANIERIGERAFEGCSALEHVYTAQKIDAKFAELTKGNLKADDDSKTETDDQIIYNATVDNFNGITANNGVIAIKAQYVFKGATDADKDIVYNVIAVDKISVDSSVTVFVPDTVTKPVEIANSLVYSSKSGFMFKLVQHVNSKVTYIGASAFAGTAKLASIDLSKATELKYIGANAFGTNDGVSCGLESIDLSCNTLLAEINGMTFAECSKLSSVVLPTSITAIGSHAFYKCANLTSVTGVSTVKSLYDDAFEGCSSLVTKPTQA